MSKKKVEKELEVKKNGKEIVNIFRSMTKEGQIGFCEKCNNLVDYEVKEIENKTEIKGKEYNYKRLVGYCKKCGEEVSSNKLTDENLKRIKEVYKKDKVFTNIKKLKCDYTTYKEQRTKYNIPIETNCSKCGKSFDKERGALECEFEHAKKLYANQLLQDGFGLGYINRQCGFGWKLSEELEKVTKDNCFVISHWQCCDKPAYRIVEIDERGNIKLWGRGSWSGGYSNWVDVNRLKEPHPKEELYEHS